MKARIIGISDEEDSKGSARTERWQYIGINSLTPVPDKMKDGLVIGSTDTTSKGRSLENLFRDCTEDYQFEESFEEVRGGKYYRAILNTEEAGF